jgi:purine nucleosidase
MKRIIIDTDPGVDDAHAIMMALAHPQANVEAITAVAGNVSLARTVANACTILDVLDTQVPVYAGCAGALVVSAEDASYVHGEDGLGNSGYPPSPRQVEAEHASLALARLANESPGELTLVAIGPLTNVAVALKLDPGLPQKLRQLVVMGGAIHARGNTSNLPAEFNIFADPEAAHVVFESWPEFTLCSWETTLAHSFDEAAVQKWLALATPRGRFFQRITTRTIEYITTTWGRSMLFGADALAMAVALEPDIVRKVAKHHVMVELHGRHTRGQTIVDWRDRSGRPPNANIVLEVDPDRFLELMDLGLC